MMSNRSRMLYTTLRLASCPVLARWNRSGIGLTRVTRLLQMWPMTCLHLPPLPVAKNSKSWYGLLLWVVLVLSVLPTAPLARPNRSPHLHWPATVSPCTKAATVSKPSIPLLPRKIFQASVRTCMTSLPTSSTFRTLIAASI